MRRIVNTEDVHYSYIIGQEGIYTILEIIIQLSFYFNMEKLFQCVHPGISSAAACTLNGRSKNC